MGTAIPNMPWRLLMRVRPFHLLLVGLAACAPTYQPAPPNPAARYGAQTRAEREAREREENARRWATFYEAHPALKGREKCVDRVLNARLPITWDHQDQIASAALSVCLPAKQWVNVFVRLDGRRDFVDPTRVEIRERDQVTAWVLTELLDDQHDFLLGRWLLDCDKKLMAVISGVWIVGGQYENPDYTPQPWQSALPNSQGEAVLNAMCKLRDARLARPAPPPARPQ